jgi:hypothetical protein
MAKPQKTQPSLGILERTDLRKPGVSALALLLLLDFTVPHHGYFGVDSTFGFAVWFGALACFSLILLALAIGSLLRVPEGTHDD